jgi:hypothetical protein
MISPRAVTEVQRALIGAAILVLAGCGTERDSETGSPGTEADSAAVHSFVQGFYDRLSVPKSSPKSGPGYWVALASGDLENDLAVGLRADSARRARRLEPARMLDLDPFLDSEDPCARYEVAEIKRSANGRYQVAVRSVCPDSISQRLQATRPIVEVRRDGNRCLVANVLYERGQNLKGILCGLARADSSGASDAAKNCVPS